MQTKLKKEMQKTKPQYPDASIIKLMLTKSLYEQYRELVKSKFHLYARETQRILKEIAKTYTQGPELKEIAVDTLRAAFMAYPNLSEKDQDTYNRIFDKVERLPQEQVNVVLRSLAQHNLFSAWDEHRFKGEVEPEQLRALVDEYESITCAVNNLDDELKFDPDSLFANCESESKHTWGLKFLKDSIPGPGIRQFIILAAYVNSGKTACAVGEAIHVAGQLEGDERILWLNNEEDNNMMRLKFISCACDKPISWVKDNREEALRIYKEHMRGDLDRIHLMDTREYSLSQVRNHLTSRQWALIVIDQMDKFDTANRKYYNKDHERLKGVYEEFRQLAYKHGTIIAISQTDASVMSVDNKKEEVYYQKYITMKQLDGSKVGKQGAADVILTIGMLDPDLPARYLHIAKAKGPGNNAKGECIIKPMVFKYQDEFEE